jgi:hypothetical protein
LLPAFHLGAGNNRGGHGDHIRLPDTQKQTVETGGVTTHVCMKKNWPYLSKPSTYA